MTSYIKNKLAKLMSAYFKDMTPDRFTLSFFKGEGVLTNLALREDVLHDLLGMPPWLVLRKATCSSVNARLSFTRLKTVPVVISIENMQIVLQATNNPDEYVQKGAGAAAMAAADSSSSGDKKEKYSSTDLIVDGLRLEVNTITVTYLGPDFDGTIDILNLSVRSTDSKWQVCDLKQAHVTDNKKGTITLFKEVVFEQLRVAIHPNSKRLPEEAKLNPVRFQVTQPAIRIIRKRSLADNTVTLSSQLQFILQTLYLEASFVQVQILQLVGQSMHNTIKIHQQHTDRSKEAASKFDEAFVKLADASGKSPDRPARPPPPGAAAASPARPAAPSSGAAAAPGSPAKAMSELDTSSVHFRVTRFVFSLREPVASRKDKPRNLATLKVNGIKGHYRAEQPFFFQPNTVDSLYKQYLEDRDVWVKQLFAGTGINPKSVYESCWSFQIGTASLSTTHYLEPKESADDHDKRQNATPSRLSKDATNSGSSSPGVGTDGSAAQSRAPEHRRGSDASLQQQRSSTQPQQQQQQQHNAQHNPGFERRTLLEANYEEFHLPPDTRMVQLEYTQYFRHAGYDGQIPPPNLYARIHPVKINFRLDELTTFLGFVDSCKLASRLSLKEQVARVEREMNEATTITELQRAGARITVLEAAPAEIEYLRQKYEDRLEYLESLLVEDAAVPAAKAETGGDEGEAVEAEARIPTSSFHLEILLPTFVLPSMPEADELAQGVSIGAVASRITLTNCPRVSKFASSVTAFQPFYRSRLNTHRDDFPATDPPGSNFHDPLPPLSAMASRPPTCGVPDLPNMMVLHLDHVWADSYRHNKKQTLLEPLSLTTWIFDAAARPEERHPAEASWYYLVHIPDTVKLDVHAPEALFLQRFLDQYDRLVMLKDDGLALPSQVVFLCVNEASIRVLDEEDAGGGKKSQAQPIFSVRLNDLEVIDQAVARSRVSRIVINSAHIHNPHFDEKATDKSRNASPTPASTLAPAVCLRVSVTLPEPEQSAEYYQAVDQIVAYKVALRQWTAREQLRQTVLEEARVELEARRRASEWVRRQSADSRQSLKTPSSPRRDRPHSLLALGDGHKVDLSATAASLEALDQILHQKANEQKQGAGEKPHGSPSQQQLARQSSEPPTPGVPLPPDDTEDDASVQSGKQSSEASPQRQTDTPAGAKTTITVGEADADGKGSAEGPGGTPSQRRPAPQRPAQPGAPLSSSPMAAAAVTVGESPSERRPLKHRRSQSFDATRRDSDAVALPRTASVSRLADLTEDGMSTSLPSFMDDDDEPLVLRQRTDSVGGLSTMSSMSALSTNSVLSNTSSKRSSMLVPNFAADAESLFDFAASSALDDDGQGSRDRLSLSAAVLPADEDPKPEIRFIKVPELPKPAVQAVVRGLDVQITSKQVEKLATFVPKRATDDVPSRPGVVDLKASDFKVLLADTNLLDAASKIQDAEARSCAEAIAVHNIALGHFEVSRDLSGLWSLCPVQSTSRPEADTDDAVKPQGDTDNASVAGAADAELRKELAALRKELEFTKEALCHAETQRESMMRSMDDMTQELVLLRRAKKKLARQISNPDDA